MLLLQQVIVGEQIDIVGKEEKATIAMVLGAVGRSFPARPVQPTTLPLLPFQRNTDDRPGGFHVQIGRLPIR